MAPGAKVDSFVLNGVNSSTYTVTPTKGTTPMTITKEDALAVYSGTEFASTGTETASSANLRLQATVTDIADGYRGNITKALVRFIITPYDCNVSMTAQPTVTTSWRTVSLINPADITVGTAWLDTSLSVGTCNAKIFDVKIEVNNYYTGFSQVATISVAKSLNDFITGGGHLDFGSGAANTSCGLYKSTDGSKTNFGFNVKYNKTGINLQGNVNIIIRSGGIEYQVKGIVGGSNGSLSTNVSDPNNKRAVLTTKASISIPATGVVIDGNGTMELIMNDKGEPGNNDTYIIRIWGSNGVLLYSSSCSGVEIPISGGNIQVRSTVIGLPTTTTVASSLNPSNFGNTVTFTATVSRGSSSLIPTGTVIFRDGSTQIGTGTLNVISTGVYKATFATNALVAGNHPITAVYSGDANFNLSTSPVLTQSVSMPLTGINTSANTGQADVQAAKIYLAINAYPNPAHEFFTLKVESNSDVPVDVRVFAINGKQVYATKGASNQVYSFGKIFINGAYIVEVKQGDKRSTLKLIKH